MDKMHRDPCNKTQRLYRCVSNHVVSKLILVNRFEDLQRRKNLGSYEFTHRQILQQKTKQLVTIPRSITQWNPLLIIILLFFLTDTTQKPKSAKIIGLLKILFYVSLYSRQLKSVYFFIKNACKPILQQVTDGSKRILVFKRMIGHFIKTPPLKKRLEYLD